MLDYTQDLHRLQAPPWLFEVAHRAASLDDRLAAGGLGPGTAARWRAAIADGDEAFFARRLAWDDLRLETLETPATPAEPMWLGWIAEALAASGPFDLPAFGLQFEGALAPFVAVAWSRLAARLASPVAASLRQDLLGVLTGRLNHLVTPSLEAHGPPADWRPVFEALPVLARLLGTAMSQWVEATEELVSRYTADRPALEGLVDAELGPLVRAQPIGSDPHHGGRVVWLARTESGAEFVYKPRSLAMEDRFWQLLGWLEARGAAHGFGSLLRLDRGTHGWVERLRFAPAADAAAVERYYWRAGALLALFHALGATDFHWENVLAVGEFPMVIDLEGLLQPGVEDDEPASDFRDVGEVMDAVNRGVLATLFLTFWLPGPGGAPEDWGGLSAPTAQGEARVNLPHLGDRPCLPGEHVAPLQAGFAETYRLIARHRDELLAPDGPLAAFVGAPVRFFFRNTRHYVLLLGRARRPEYLVDGLARSFALDRLARTYRACDERPPFWPLIGAERAQLERLDVPAFTLAADEHAMAGTTCPMPTSPLTRARARLARLGEADLAVQKQVIDLTFPPTGSPELPPRQFDPQGAGLAIAEVVAGKAIALDEGAAWLRGAAHPKAGREVPGMILFGGWEGAAGVALLFAAAAHATGDACWRDLALAALGPVRARAARQHVQRGDGAVNWATTARAFAQVGRILEEPLLAQEAVAMLKQVPDLGAATMPDAYGGLGDWLFAAIALHAETGESEALALARRAGDRLLAIAEPGDLSARGWRTASAEGKHLAGFAHGQCGIAAALLRLYELTENRAYRDAALESLAYEDALYEPSLANWRIAGQEDAEGGPVAWAAWCHGLAGASLARLVIARHESARREELDRALAALVDHEDHTLDFLCCGNFGRVEALLSAGTALDRPELSAAAQRLAARRWTAGAFGFEPARSALDLDPSYLRGLAGIGYTMFRLGEPRALASWLGGA